MQVWGMLHRLQQTRGMQQPQPWSGAARRSANACILPCLAGPTARMFLHSKWLMRAQLLCLHLQGGQLRPGGQQHPGERTAADTTIGLLLIRPCPSRGLPRLRDAGGPAAAPRPAPAPRRLASSCAVLSWAVLSCATCLHQPSAGLLHPGRHEVPRHGAQPEAQP